MVNGFHLPSVLTLKDLPILSITRPYWGPLGQLFDLVDTPLRCRTLSVDKEFKLNVLIRDKEFKLNVLIRDKISWAFLT